MCVVCICVMFCVILLRERSNEFGSEGNLSQIKVNSFAPKDLTILGIYYTQK